MKTVLTALLLAMLHFIINAHHNRMESIIKVHPISEKVCFLEGQGGNIGVFNSSEGFVLVDDQFAHLHNDIMLSLKSISPKSVKYVINTHWHVDHTNGNEKFGTDGAVIIAQKNSDLRMRSPQVIQVFNHHQKPYAKEGLPKISFEEQYTLSLSDEEIDLIAVPHAHTDGDLIVHFKTENVIHTGDVFVTYGYPFIDTPNGGSLLGVLKALELILSLSDEETKIIPGHGYISTRKDVLAYRDMLLEIWNRVEPALQKGKTKKEIMALQPTKGYSSAKINESIFVDILMDSYKRK